MYVNEPQKDGNIPDFNISKIDICPFRPFRAYQRSFRLFHGYFSKDIHQRSRLLCFTQNDHTGHAGFKICPFLKWAFYALCQHPTANIKLLSTFLNKKTSKSRSLFGYLPVLPYICILQRYTLNLNINNKLI